MEQLTASIIISDRFSVNPTSYLIKISAITMSIKGDKGIFNVIVHKGYFGKTYRNIKPVIATDTIEVFDRVVKKLKGLK